METNKQYSGKQKTVKTKLNNMTDHYKRTISARSGRSEARNFNNDIVHKRAVAETTVIRNFFVAYTVCCRTHTTVIFVVYFRKKESW